MKASRTLIRKIDTTIKRVEKKSILFLYGKDILALQD